MPDNDHSRARHLIDCARVEGIDAAEHEWLDRHLEACATCAARARATDSAIRGVRLNSVTLPVDLAARTQYRVSLRARELPHRQHTLALWIALVLSWILGIASAPLVWRGFEWAGGLIGLPSVWLKLGFGLWWGLPALLAAAIWAIENRKMEEQ
jgi:anti-sigma factor RsiW